MMYTKASEGNDLEYNNEIVKLSPHHEVFQNYPKFPHEGPLHASDRDFVRNHKNVVKSLSVAYMCSLLLLICCALPVVKNINVDRCGSLKMIYYVSNNIPSFILVVQLIVMSQVVQIRGRDTNQVGRHIPHLM
jgi:hypothetical protein